jgi:hypothetical protein
MQFGSKVMKSKPGQYPKVQLINTDTQFFGNGWDVQKLEEKFFLSYISGAIEGKAMRIEITEEDYIAARRGDLDLDDFCVKYHIN